MQVYTQRCVMQFNQGIHTMAKTEIECETDNERG